MTTIVGLGDRLITPSGRPSWLKRPSVPLNMFGGQSLALDGKTLSFQQLYEQQPWVSVVVNKVNRQVVRLPLHLMRSLPNGEAERVYEHPLVELMEHPWRGGSCASLKQKLTFPALVHGNGLIAKRRPDSGRPPTSLQPLDWRYVQPLWEGTQVIGWRSTEFGDELFAPEDVIHMAWEGGQYGCLGISPLSALEVTIRSEDSAQRYQASAFVNGARPSGAFVLAADADVNESERDELRQAIKDSHGGVDNASSVLLLSGGADWKTMSHTAVEAELIQQRKLNREEVAACYDMDPPLVGILDHATYSNVGEMHKMLYGPTLGPWLMLEAETLNSQLIYTEKEWENDGLFFRFDLTEVLKANTGEEMQAVVQGIGAAIFTPNEGRQRFGLRPSANKAADELFIPANNLQPLGSQPTAPPDRRQKNAPFERWVQIAATKAGAGQPFPTDRCIAELVADGIDPDTAQAFAQLYTEQEAA